MFSFYRAETHVVDYMNDKATKARRQVASQRRPDGTALARSRGSTLDPSSESRLAQGGKQTNEIQRHYQLAQGS